MKRISLFIISICSATMMIAQTNSQNYISTRTMLNDGGSSYMDQFQYHDGLGRPFMLVKKGVTGSRANLASLLEYDAFGRQEKDWLPIVTTADYVTATSFRSSASGNYNNDLRPYNQFMYKTSPLEHIAEQYGPGSAWYSEHSTKTAYFTNNAQAPFNCINYYVSSTGTLTSRGNYATGQLYVTQTTDEDKNVTYVFKDKQEHTVLIRQMKGSEPNDTYYVYDDFGNLGFVLQPMYQSSANIDLYAFHYKYDSRNRCIWKKLPGSQNIEYIYDNADRLTFSQDGKQRNSNRWTFYQYDNFDRLVKQGECTGKNLSSNPVVHIQNYYDNYSFRSQSGFNNSNFPDGGNNGKGLLTGRLIAILGSSTNIYFASYYDAKNRVVKTVQSNLLGGYDIAATNYTFTDKPLNVTHTHTASGKPTCTEVYAYTYDHADRLEKVEHTLNGTKVVLLSNVYDNLGRLSAKSLHGSSANKLNYSYNIRSWLTGISSTRFTQNLYYTDGSNATKCYNGNISSMTWKSGTESTVRGYKFDYDDLNRLMNATYGEGSSISSNTNRFSENVTSYDKNGNIKNLQRHGQTSSTTYGLIDNLTYTLTGNRLNRVDDAITASAYNGGFEFKNATSMADEYAYDANGNLTEDSNKGITEIQYNVLNLPSCIKFGSDNITYIYSAEGTKLRTIHKIGSTTTTTDYCGNVIYENNTAKLLLTEQGYVSLNDNKYHYYLQDHQGNNRVVVDKDGNVEETNHYYPFGGIFANTNNVQTYKYNGKELDVKKGLDWYDYGARHYDAALGCWHMADPLAEERYGFSMYNYVQDNPINRVDYTGMLDDWVEDKNKKIYWDPKAVSQETTKKGETYLGKTVVVFNGSRDEKLGSKSKNDFGYDGKHTTDYIDGVGASVADVIVYGSNGENDIKHYTGFTMTSNFSKFGAIDNGDYDVTYRNPGKSGTLKSNYAINNAGPVNCLDGINSSPAQYNPYSPTQKNGVYIHRTNNSGWCGGGVSTGCLLIYARQWTDFTNQIGERNFKLKLIRK